MYSNRPGVNLLNDILSQDRGRLSIDHEPAFVQQEQ
jgi:hypothetical protein